MATLDWLARLGRVAVNGGELVYADNAVEPVPGAATVVCLHGFPDIPRGFAPFLEAFGARGHRVVAPWMRGYPPSVAKGAVTIEALVVDIQALIDQVSPTAPVILIGHDWGAAVAYALTAKSPERIHAAITMAVPHPLSFLRQLARPAQLRRSWYMFAFQAPGSHLLAMANDGALIDRLWSTWSPALPLDRGYRDEVHDTLRRGERMPFAYYQGMTRPLGAAFARLRPSSQASTKIVVPTLYLHGADDGCILPASSTGASSYFQGVYDARTIDSVGHFLHLEAPHAVIHEIVSWLATLPSTSPAAVSTT